MESDISPLIRQIVKCLLSTMLYNKDKSILFKLMNRKEPKYKYCFRNSDNSIKSEGVPAFALNSRIFQAIPTITDEKIYV